MGRSSRGEAPAPYTQHDTAVWHTRQIVARVRAGDLAGLPRLATPFPPRAAADEVVVAGGGVDVLTWRALGDGTYTHDGGFFFATGAAGLAATAAVAGVRALGNSARRSAAAADARPRWVVDWSAQLYVSTHAFYFESRTGLHCWFHGDVLSMELVGPAAVLMRGQGTQGAVAWVLHTHWAELLLVLWALRHHPAHPQLVGDAWVPPGWYEREQARVASARAQVTDR